MALITVDVSSNALTGTWMTHIYCLTGEVHRHTGVTSGRLTVVLQAVFRQNFAS